MHRRTWPLSTVWSASASSPTRDVAVSAAILVLERAGTIAFALELVRGTRETALLASGALAALYAARAILRSTQRSAVQERLHAATAHALLGGDVLRASPLDDEDAQGAVLDGAVYGSRFVADIVPDLVADALVGIVIMAWFVAAQPFGVVAASAVGLGAAAGAAILVRRTVRRHEDRAWRLHGPVVDDLLAMLSSRLELVANGREVAFLGDVKGRLAAWRRASLHADRLSMLVGRLPILALVLGLAIGIWAGASWKQMLEGRTALETALVVAGLPSFVGLARALHEVVRVGTRVRALAEILEGARGEHARTGHVLGEAPRRVDAEGAAFAYTSAGRVALSAASFSWCRGAPLVLTGPNGAGKSTALRLLLGLAKPTAGKILVDGRDLRELDGAAWRRGIAYLAQRPYLSDRATVREAIHLLAPDATDDAMHAVLQSVEVWAALTSSGTPPLDVRIGTLSVGQRQRVALARVLAIDAPVLLLDEPDANLDQAGIARVRAIVKELSPHKLIAVVAHTEELFDLAGTLVRLPANVASDAQPPAAPKPSGPSDDART